MSDSFKIQQNVKVGNDLINLRADTPDEFQWIANWVIENAALLVNVQTALNGVPPALAGNVTHTQVVQGGTPAEQAYQQQTQQNNGGWGAPPQQGPPQWSQPAQMAPTCRHGEMEYKDFTSKAGNHVKGHFCRSTNRQDQCPPVYPPKGR